MAKKKKKQYEIEEMDYAPYFDMETFMIASRTKRVDVETAQIADECWGRWREKVEIRKITTKSKSYLLVWLGEDVENEVNTAWEASPSKAYSMNNVAQAMLMAVIQDLIPEVAYGGCAPVPMPAKPLTDALKEIGVPWQDANCLARQYAMLTNFPYAGGCDICLLKGDCAKLTMEKAQQRQDGEAQEQQGANAPQNSESE